MVDEVTIGFLYTVTHLLKGSKNVNKKTVQINLLAAREFAHLLNNYGWVKKKRAISSV